MSKKRGLLDGKVLIDESVSVEKINTDNHATDGDNPKDLVNVEYLNKVINQLKKEIAK